MIWWVGPGGEPSEHKAARTKALEAAANKTVGQCKKQGHEPKNVTVRWLGDKVEVYRCCRCEAVGYGS